MQVLMISGNVGNVKEVRDAGSDRVLNFSVAVDNGKDKSGERRESTWYDCALWGKRADSLSQYITKGGKITVTGRPGVRVHEGKAYLTLTVNDLTLQGGKSEGSDRGSASESSSHRETEQKSNYTYDLTDDIPF